MLELNEMAKSDGERYKKKRYLYHEIKKHIGKRIFIGILGPRGAGKTVLLRQLLAEVKNAFYISLDSILLERTLFEIAKELESKGVKLLLLDEVHFIPNFQAELKKIFDFLKIQVIFTGSVSISVHDSSLDLSRRVKTYFMYPFSFDEWIYFRHGKKIRKLKPSEFLDSKKCKKYYADVLGLEAFFEDYLKGGLYPFTLETDYDVNMFSNILNKVIHRDLVETGKITREEIRDLKKIIKFIGVSPVEDVSYSSVARNTGVSKYKVEKYITLLEKSFVVNVVFPKGTNVIREPKILMNLPYRLIFKPYDLCIGELKEEFFVETSKYLGFNISYLKTMRGRKTPDYYIEELDVVAEIGGKGKSRSQFKGIENKRKIILTYPGVLDPVKRPLFLWGMLKF